MSNIELLKIALENVSGKKLEGSFITMGEMLKAFNTLYIGKTNKFPEQDGKNQIKE